MDGSENPLCQILGRPKARREPDHKKECPGRLRMMELRMEQGRDLWTGESLHGGKRRAWLSLLKENIIQRASAQSFAFAKAG